MSIANRNPMRRGAKPRPPVKPKKKLKTPRAGQFGHRSRAATHKELAARGGRKAHQLGTAHEYDSDEATEAGRKSSLLRRHDREKEQREARIAERLQQKGLSDAPIHTDTD